MIYKCEKCNKLFKQKNDYRRHINKKKPCFLNFKKECCFTCPHCNKTYKRNDNLQRHIDVSCKYNDPLKNNKSIKQSQNDNIKPILTNINCNENTNSKHEKSSNLNIAPDEILFPPKQFAYKCNYCDSVFSKKYNLQRHENNRCQKKTKFDSDQIIIKQLLNEMNEKIKNMEKENNEKLKIIEKENIELKNKLSFIENKQTNVINNNNNNNISNNNNNILNNTQINNINIVAFGKENLDEIVSDSVCKKILFKGFEAVPQLIEYIHFNEKKPEFHNCYIPSLKDKYAERAELLLTEGTLFLQV